MGYCNCLNYSINRFIKKDTVDISLDFIIDKMDFYGGYFIRSKNMYPLLDSAAMSISLKEEKYQFTNGRVEGAYGKVAYRLECIEFYKSKQLDSLAKTIARQINDSIYIDPFYKK